MIAYYIYRTLKGGAAIRISTIAGVRKAPRTWRYWLRHAPFVLRVAAFSLMIVALARPQGVEEQSKTNAEGIDIMLAIDISGSMLARDFQPDRLTAAKEVAGSFRDNILSKGGIRHPMDLYVAFRGHKPATQALIDEIVPRK